MSRVRTCIMAAAALFMFSAWANAAPWRTVRQILLYHYKDNPLISQFSQQEFYIWLDVIRTITAMLTQASKGNGNLAIQLKRRNDYKKIMTNLDDLIREEQAMPPDSTHSSKKGDIFLLIRNTAQSFFTKHNLFLESKTNFFSGRLRVYLQQNQFVGVRSLSLCSHSYEKVNTPNLLERKIRLQHACEHLTLSFESYEASRVTLSATISGIDKSFSKNFVREQKLMVTAMTVYQKNSNP